jgi:hypothetical protein
MEWFSVEQGSFFAAVWLAAFLVSLCDIVRGDRAKSLGFVCGTSGFAGFLALGIVALYFHDSGVGVPPDPWRCIGAASLIGASGRYQHWILIAALKKYGLVIKEEAPSNEPR